jgi:hypothetical protein
LRTSPRNLSGHAALSRPDAGFKQVFLRTGLPTFKPATMAGRRADGLLVAFVVDDVDGEYERLIAEGVAITTPIETEEWGERYFQVTDPCGVVPPLVQWVAAPHSVRAARDTAPRRVPRAAIRARRSGRCSCAASRS